MNMYKPISIDRKNLTIMGVSFPDLATLDRTANAIGSNMYEGFVQQTANHNANRNTRRAVVRTIKLFKFVLKILPINCVGEQNQLVSCIYKIFQHRAKQIALCDFRQFSKHNIPGFRL